MSETETPNIPELAEGATIYPVDGKPIILVGKEHPSVICEIVVDRELMNKQIRALQKVSDAYKARRQIWLDEEPDSTIELDCE